MMATVPAARRCECSYSTPWFIAGKNWPWQSGQSGHARLDPVPCTETADEQEHVRRDRRWRGRSDAAWLVENRRQTTREAMSRVRGPCLETDQITRGP